MISGRYFLTALKSLALIAFFSLPVMGGEQKVTARPNIILIMVDDKAAYEMLLDVILNLDKTRPSKLNK